MSINDLIEEFEVFDGVFFEGENNKEVKGQMIEFLWLMTKLVVDWVYDEELGLV